MRYAHRNSSGLPSARDMAQRLQKESFHRPPLFCGCADAGAELIFFSPLTDPLPHRLDGMYLGGGYPELHASQLSANRPLLYAIRAFAAAGGIIYGECGGLMYLSREIEVGAARWRSRGILALGCGSSSCNSARDSGQIVQSTMLNCCRHLRFVVGA